MSTAMPHGWSESHAEQGIPDVVAEREWEHRPGPSLAPGSGERDSWHDIVLRGTAVEGLHSNDRCLLLAIEGGPS